MIYPVLYCSYKGSPVGYQMSLAYMEQRELIPSVEAAGRIPPSVKNYFSHGGANAICGYDSISRVYFMLAKRIEIEDESKRFDEMGRKVFINIALFSPNREEITVLTKGFFGQYNAIRKAFSELLLLDDSVLGYQANFPVLQQVIDSSIAYGSSPYCPDLLGVSYSEAAISFASVEAGWDYFAKMCKLSPADKPRTCISKENYEGQLQSSSVDLYQTQKKAEPKEKTEDIIKEKAETKEKTEDSYKEESGENRKKDSKRIVSTEKQSTNISEKTAPDKHFDAELVSAKEFRRYSDATQQQIDKLNRAVYEQGVQISGLDDRLSDYNKKQKSKFEKISRQSVLPIILAGCALLAAIVALIIALIK